MTEPNRRLGSVIFTGESPALLRTEALSGVRAILVLGGNDGTTEEVAIARQHGLGVVPVGSTGGSAKTLWDEMANNLDAFTLGGRAIPRDHFDRLTSDDEQTCARSAAQLIVQALSLR